jgi:uncharacterized membrane protein YhfC
VLLAFNSTAFQIGRMMLMTQDHDNELKRFSIGLVVFCVIALLAHAAGYL